MLGARAANEIQQVAHEAAEQIDARNRRLDVAAEFVRQLQDELHESREEATPQRAMSERLYSEYQAEQRRMQMDWAVYDNAVGQEEHELMLELEAAERLRRRNMEMQRTIEALVEARQSAIEEARPSREAEHAFVA